jgi:hypothetical protein
MAISSTNRTLVTIMTLSILDTDQIELKGYLILPTWMWDVTGKGEMLTGRIWSKSRILPKNIHMGDKTFTRFYLTLEGIDRAELSRIVM